MSEDAEYGLVMPFLCVQDHGGPLDPKAFVHGVRFGTADCELKAKPKEYQVYDAPFMEKQYDLLAMHRGYLLTAEPWDEHPDEYALFTFKRIEDSNG